MEYYSLSRSVRALGMGNAFYSLSDDEGALFYNPAGLSLYRGGWQVMPLNVQGQISSDGFSAISTLIDSFRNTSDVSQIVTSVSSLQGNPVYAGGAVFPYFLKNGFAVGVLVADVKADFALLGAGVASGSRHNCDCGQRGIYWKVIPHR